MPKVKKLVCDNSPEDWEIIDYVLLGHKNAHFKTAIFTVRKGSFTKEIRVLRVRNDEEARMMLKKLHGIE